MGSRARSLAVTISVAACVAFSPAPGPLASVPLIRLPAGPALPLALSGRKCVFRLDTSLERSAVSARVAATLDRPVSRVRGHDLVDDVSVQIGRLFLPHEQLVVEGLADEQVDGVLGADLIARFVVDVRWTDGRVRLWQSSSYVPPRKRRELPASFDDGLPVVRGALGLDANGQDVAVALAVATSAPSGMMARYRFAEAHGLLDAAEAPRTVPASIAGWNATLEIRVPSAPDSPSHALIDGTIGATTLSPVWIVFDAARQRIIIPALR